jgi:vanillate/3-O-methylgallate O-demethylase
MADGKLVGLSTYTVYTTNVRGWFSLAMVDEDVADGTVLTVVWGEENGSPRRACVVSDIQTEIRATLSYNRLNEDA